MGLIHRTIKKTETKIIRSPLIMDKKIEFIKRRKVLFDFIMVTDYNWRHKEKWGAFSGMSMKGRMPSIGKSCYGPKALLLAEKIREVFGYNEKTDVLTILFTFRRLYFKIYNK